MDNPFLGMQQAPEVGPTGYQVVCRLSDEDRKQKLNMLYATYTPMVYHVLDQLFDVYQPGIWKKGSDCDHRFCCHCRWYAGPEETGHASYDDHPMCWRIEIELVIDDQGYPTGFIILNPTNPGKCVYVGLSQNELVRGIKAVLY